jgi:hypothetical protein
MHDGEGMCIDLSVYITSKYTERVFNKHEICIYTKLCGANLILANTVMKYKPSLNFDGQKEMTSESAHEKRMGMK